MDQPICTKVDYLQYSTSCVFLDFHLDCKHHFRYRSRADVTVVIWAPGTWATCAQPTPSTHSSGHPFRLVCTTAPKMMWRPCSAGTFRPLKLCIPRAASFNRNSDFGDQQTTTTYVLRLYTALPAALQSAFHCAKLFRGTPHGSQALNRGRN